MPVYDYECEDKNCAEHFEEMVKLSEFDTAVILCPKCGKVAKRILTTVVPKHTSWLSWKL